MTLLTEVMERPLDPGYEAASQRRRLSGGPPSTGTRTPLAVGAAVLVGLLLTSAALELRAPDPAGLTARELLQSEINERAAQTDEQQQGVAALRAEIEDVQAELLAVTATGLVTRVERLALVSGAAPATGPGVQVVLDDAPRADDPGLDSAPRTEADDLSRVQDRDLALVVNYLWDAGAEAVAVNGQRLTALSAIRSAGEAILVDFRPLTPPYTVTALGDPGDLQARFARGDGGRVLQSLQSNYGIVARTTESEELTVPGASRLTLRRADPLEPEPAPAASPGATGPGESETGGDAP